MWCLYCKRKIKSSEKYVVHNDDYYHEECYSLIADELEESEEE